MTRKTGSHQISAQNTREQCTFRIFLLGKEWEEVTYLTQLYQPVRCEVVQFLLLPLLKGVGESQYFPPLYQAPTIDDIKCHSTQTNKSSPFFILTAITKSCDKLRL